jgi:hypothetical protein
VTEPTASTVRHLAMLATRAPSVHNSQPWRLVMTGRGLEVWADRTRLLPVIDPQGRQLLVSCGALVHHVVVAALALGLEPQVELLPTRDADLAARITLTPTGRSPWTADVQRAVAILRRTTDRTRFQDAPVPDAFFEQLWRAAEQQGAMLIRASDADRVLLDVLVAHAEEELRSDEAYLSELGHWVFDPEQRPDRADGIPLAAVDPGPGRAEEAPGRRFTGTSTAVSVPAPRAAERPDLLLLTTAGDDPRDWLQAGKALSALLLEGTQLGLAAQPLGQVTDVPHERVRLRRELGLVGVPQLLLRLGPAPRASALVVPRRDVDTVLSWA